MKDTSSFAPDKGASFMINAEAWAYSSPCTRACSTASRRLLTPSLR
jgi:hypothetical protein